MSDDLVPDWAPLECAAVLLAFWRSAAAYETDRFANGVPANGEAVTFPAMLTRRTVSGRYLHRSGREGWIVDARGVAHAVVVPYSYSRPRQTSGPDVAGPLTEGDPDV